MRASPATQNPLARPSQVRGGAAVQSGDGQPPIGLKSGVECGADAGGTVWNVWGEGEPSARAAGCNGMLIAAKGSIMERQPCGVSGAGWYGWAGVG